MDDLINDAPCGFIVFNDRGLIQTANRTLAQMLGYEEGGLNNAQVEQIFTIATKIFYNTHLFPLLKLEGKANEIYFSLASRTRQSVAVIANCIRKEINGEWQIHCALFSISQRNKYEQELLAAKKSAEDANNANKELMELKARLEEHGWQLDHRAAHAKQSHERLLQMNKILSHDFQEPIRKIRIFTDALRKAGGTDLKIGPVNGLDKIDAAAVRLHKLATVLEQFIRLEASDGITIVDVGEMIRAQAKEISVKHSRNIKLSVPDLPEISGSAWQLRELFSHLIENAVVHNTSDETIIQVEAIIIKENAYQASSDRYHYVDNLRLTIADNGPGFDSRYTEYVFDILNRLSTGNESMGLGLALSRKIVENHSGKISMQSSKGSGTTVTVELPINTALHLDNYANGSPLST